MGHMVGHILRLEEGRMLRVAIEEEWKQQGFGDRGLLFDTPKVDTFDELVMIASDRDLWRGLVKIKAIVSYSRRRC